MNGHEYLYCVFETEIMLLLSYLFEFTVIVSVWTLFHSYSDLYQCLHIAPEWRVEIKVQRLYSNIDVTNLCFNDFILDIQFV